MNDPYFFFCYFFASALVFLIVYLLTRATFKLVSYVGRRNGLKPVYTLDDGFNPIHHKHTIAEQRAAREVLENANRMFGWPCGHCGKMGAVDKPFSIRWPNQTPVSGNVHYECEMADCQRACEALTEQQRDEFLQTQFKA